MKKIARINNFREKAILYSHDIAKTWCLVNEISNRKRKNTNSIKCLSDKNGKKPYLLILILALTSLILMKWILLVCLFTVCVLSSFLSFCVLYSFFYRYFLGRWVLLYSYLINLNFSTQKGSTSEQTHPFSLSSVELVVSLDPTKIITLDLWFAYIVFNLTIKTMKTLMKP